MKMFEIDATKHLESDLTNLVELHSTAHHSSPEELAEQNEFDVFVHPSSDLPLPYGLEEKNSDLIFLDPSIGEGKRLITDKTTTNSQLFAVMRQFISPVCSNIGLVVDEMLRRNVNVNDVDATTGMAMLHYAIRAASLTGKQGMGVVKRLLCSGADPSLRCLYTDMNALHVAAYFDVSPAVALLLKSCDLWSTVPIESVCGSYEYGTSLHIAAACLSCSAAEVLLQKGANCDAKDDLGRTPEQCIPANFSSSEEKLKSKHLRELLCRKTREVAPIQVNVAIKGKGSRKGSTGKGPDRERRKSDTVYDFAAGDRVVVAGSKLGTVRFVGGTQFASGTWCGVELDKEGAGGNDGSVAGVRYFRCKSSKGIFAPASKLQRQGPRQDNDDEGVQSDRRSSRVEPRDRDSRSADRSTSRGRTKKTSTTANTRRSKSSSAVNQADDLTSGAAAGKVYLKPGMRVDVKGSKHPVTIKFLGRTDFASGLWVGLDLGTATGRNDGSVQGRRYFTCPPKHGVMVRPSRVSYKGASGGSLLPPDLDDVVKGN